ncbi:hypothetical protein EVAR_2696_1 [Eumeta japonica]|uniref:Uncharacterized protein n=1 Tax=Eumeta variegata TaxID=151549 RepID=A0A4C1SQF9_EUMVA|nr:hypothetical protein EVAR_2696_1 [Eumeta japonica]
MQRLSAISVHSEINDLGVPWTFNAILLFHQRSDELSSKFQGITEVAEEKSTVTNETTTDEVTENIELLKSIKSYELKLFERDSECQSLQQQMQHLQNNLAELTAQIELRRLNFISNSNVDPKLSHDTLPSGSLDCTACTQETKQMTGAVHAVTPRTGRRDSPRSRRVSSQHAAPTDGQNVIMYSDEFGRVAQQPKPVSSLSSRFCAWEDHGTRLVFCDLSRHLTAFIMTLIRKLHHYGVTGRSLGLLESYLSDRIQRVDINGERSSGSAVNMGATDMSIMLLTCYGAVETITVRLQLLGLNDLECYKHLLYTSLQCSHSPTKTETDQHHNIMLTQHDAHYLVIIRVLFHNRRQETEEETEETHRLFGVTIPAGGCQWEQMNSA